jgi:hypothetical protein
MTTLISRVRERLQERRNLKRLKKYMARIPAHPSRPW